MDKQALRKEIKQQKKLLSVEQVEKAPGDVFKAIEAMDYFKQCNCMLCYWSLPDELATHEFINKWYLQKNIYLPVVNGQGVDLIQYTGIENMKQGAFGILEPIGIKFQELHLIDLAIIPGVAFTAVGQRMGRGGGYYDRLLPSLSKAFKLGVAYQLQQRDFIPIESHDIKLDTVIFG